MYMVCVLDKNKKPLMPTKRFWHVRKLLKSCKAKVVSTKPFVIQLLYESTNYIQPLYGGIDPGRTNIGMAVVDRNGNVVYSAHTTTRNKDIVKVMQKRAACRHESRQGRRLRRKRRAKQNKTTTIFPLGRKLPGYKDGVMQLKDIINSETRFNNRKWKMLNPTIRHCILTHINIVKMICKILPVNNWTIEYNQFIQGMTFENKDNRIYQNKKR